MNSLKARLILSVALVFATGFLIASVTIYAVSRTSMYAEFDEALRAQAQALTALTDEDQTGVHFELTEGFEEFTRKESPGYFELWLDGKVLARSPQLYQGDLKFGNGSLVRPSYDSIRLPDGRTGRQICISFQPKWSGEDFAEDVWEDDDFWEDTVPLSSEQHGVAPAAAAHDESGVFTLTWQPPERRVTIAVAKATTDIEQWLSSLLWILPSVGVAITLLSSGVLIFVVRRGLAPVDSVAQAINKIDETSLGDRIPTDQVPSEIKPMVVRLNDLLGRLESAFHHERAFSSNLAHELRTPLAGLRSTLEVYLSRLHHPQEYEEALRACLEICDQSQNLVESLLSLARIEGDSFRCRQESVDVSNMFEECWQPLVKEATIKQIRTSFRMSPQVIQTDREMIRVILRNVLSNAVCYCDAGGRIEASFAEASGRFVMRVSNTGHQLTEAQTARVFDRLWRGDQARDNTGWHFGLGLTLTKQFVEKLGGSTEVTTNEMFHISISLPV